MIGVAGFGNSGFGVLGFSDSNAGVVGRSNGAMGVWGEGHENLGVLGTSRSSVGVGGYSQSSEGVHGESASDVGVKGFSPGTIGVFGESPNGLGVLGRSIAGAGVTGQSNAAAGVEGGSTGGPGVSGESANDIGVVGRSPQTGMLGESNKIGVLGRSTDGVGVRGQSSAGVGISGSVADPRGLAGHFRGRVLVDGDFTVTGAKGAVVPHPDGSHRLFCAIESPESWFEDFAEGKLEDGRAESEVALDFALLTPSTRSATTCFSPRMDRQTAFMWNTAPLGASSSASNWMERIRSRFPIASSPGVATSTSLASRRCRDHLRLRRARPARPRTPGLALLQ